MLKAVRGAPNFDCRRLGDRSPQAPQGRLGRRLLFVGDRDFAGKIAERQLLINGLSLTRSAIARDFFWCVGLLGAHPSASF
jgi:hypothetical protein